MSAVSCAYLASTAVSTDFVQHILPLHLCNIPLHNQDAAEALQCDDHN